MALEQGIYSKNRIQSKGRRQKTRGAVMMSIAAVFVIGGMIWFFVTTESTTAVHMVGIGFMIFGIALFMAGIGIFFCGLNDEQRSRQEGQIYTRF